MEFLKEAKKKRFEDETSGQNLKAKRDSVKRVAYKQAKIRRATQKTPLYKNGSGNQLQLREDMRSLSDLQRD